MINYYISIVLLLQLFTASCSDDDENKDQNAPKKSEVRYELNELHSGLENPWSLCFPSDHEILITERGGNLVLFNLNTGKAKDISGVPEVAAIGQGGLLDIILHPDFKQNKLVYFSYAASGTDGANTAVGRAEFDGNQLINREKIFQAQPFLQGGSHFGSRLIFDDGGFLYVSVGDRGTPDNAQDSSNHCGKLLRLNADGSAPSDNPFVDVNGAMPEIYTMGNRNIQGMDIRPETREIYTHEHGPRGCDEINLMKAGENYGWPKVTHGENYDGTPITPHTSLEGYKDPLHHWTPSVAPCGMAFLPDDFPAPDDENLFIGTLAAQHLKGVKLVNDKVLSTNRYFEGQGRFRAIECLEQRCFVLTESPGKLYELIPEPQ